MLADLVRIYCSLICSVLEYASPVWAALPEYLVSTLESIQKRVLKIIFPAQEIYDRACCLAGLEPLVSRRSKMAAAFVNADF